MTSKNNLHMLQAPQMDAAMIPADRCNGKTTAQAFLLIAKAMNNPGSKLNVIDHASGIGKARLVNKLLLDRIMEILARTGMQFFECGQATDGTPWLRFNLYSE